MSTMDYAVKILNSLSEEKLKAFITLFADENTVARMESNALAGDENPKLYNSFREFMDEAEQEDGE